MRISIPRPTFLLAIVLALSPSLLGARDATTPDPLQVGRNERLLVIAPHPDDETIGAGGLMQRVLAGGGTVDVVMVTAGDGYVGAVRGETGTPSPRPQDFIAYGERRLRESRAALDVFGHERTRLTVLGFPDGGLASLLSQHWQRSNPARSVTTGASDPPYDAVALDPALPYNGEDLRRALTSLIRSRHPTIIALPDPRDVHTDHSAAGTFALLAIADWLHGEHAQATGAATRPDVRVLAYLVHWPAWPPGWDATSSTPEDGQATLELPPDLPLAHAQRTTLALDANEVALKGRAMAQYVTQQRQMTAFLAAFVRRSEPFTLLSLDDVRAGAARLPLKGPTIVH